MIERLLAAEEALAEGRLDAAAALYEQISAADPRNAIAIVGMARTARARGDAVAARELAARALSIDPDEAAARRLVAELDAAEAAPSPAPGSAEATPPAVPARPAAPPPRPTLVARLRRWLSSLVRRA